MTGGPNHTQTAAALVRTGAKVIRTLIEQLHRETGYNFANAGFEATDADGNSVISQGFADTANSLEQLSKNPELQFLLLPRISSND